MEKQFLNKTKFSSMIEKEVCDKKISYMEAIIGICDNNDIEVEDVSKYISPIIKSKIEAEARNLNFLPKLNVLPV